MFQPSEGMYNLGPIQEPWALELIQKIEKALRHRTYSTFGIIATFAAMFGVMSYENAAQTAFVVVAALLFGISAYHGIKYSGFILDREWQAKHPYVAAELKTFWSWPWSPPKIVVLHNRDPWLDGWAWDYFTRRGKATRITRETFEKPMREKRQK